MNDYEVFWLFMLLTAILLVLRSISAELHKIGRYQRFERDFDKHPLQDSEK